MSIRTTTSPCESAFALAEKEYAPTASAGTRPGEARSSSCLLLALGVGPMPLLSGHKKVGGDGFLVLTAQGFIYKYECFALALASMDRNLLTASQRAKQAPLMAVGTARLSFQLPSIFKSRSFGPRDRPESFKTVQQRLVHPLRPIFSSLVKEDQSLSFTETEAALAEAHLGIQGRGRAASPQQLKTSSSCMNNNRKEKENEKVTCDGWFLAFSVKLLQYCIPVLFFLLHLPVSATAEPLYYTCDGSGRVVTSNYTANSTFASNLSLLLASLSTTKSNFTTDSKGSVPDRAYGLILCRGDAKPPDCLVCLRNTAQDVLSLCPLSKQATIWYDNCELRYADLSFFSVMYEYNYKILIMGNNATNMELKAFAGLKSRLLDSVMSAAYNSSLMFATGIAGDGMKPKIYALAQCTRDLSADGCSRCLQQMRARYEDYPGNIYQEGGRVLEQSCNFRYESEPFFADGKPTVSLGLPKAAVPLPTAPNEEGTKNNTRKVLLIVIPVAVGMATIFIIGICFWRRSRSAKNIKRTITLELGNISNTEWLLFDLSMLKAATLNFADSKKLGQGGFGTVYKGTLPSGEEVAVKRLSVDSRQGIQELKNELVLVAKFQHRNLVRLRGVCLEEGEKLLVYEYVPNGSLDDFLFDPVRSEQLNWETRFKIIRGVAKGLLYLHEESHIKVIHRDLKASNVLLDEDMSPKISDFGLARLFGEDETHGVTSRVVGTFGYMAPEYARRGHFSMKLDVYSFGILVLEIVTGKRNNGFHYDSEISQDIVSYIWEPWENGTALGIVDPSMGENFPSNEVLTCIHIGLLCAQEVPANRPCISSVVHMLHGPSMPPEEPLHPIASEGNCFVDSSVSSKLSDLNSSEEFARMLYRTDEDVLLIKHKSMSGTKRMEWNLVSNRQTM